MQSVTEDQQRRTAAEIEQSHPQWLVIWGCYSRMFWAFPRFRAPSGTIVSASDRQRLVQVMQRVEGELGAALRMPSGASPALATQLPREPSSASIQQDPPEAWPPVRDYDAPMPDPAKSDPSDSDPHDPHAFWQDYR